jgi:hypothetical protein
MTENYYVGAYWPGRREPEESYADRAAVFLRQLASLDPSLTRWFEQAGSREAALASQLTLDSEMLRGLFQKPTYRKGMGDLSFAAWNGEAADSSVVSVSCGSRSARVLDRCTLTLPSQGQRAEQLLRASVLTQALRALVLAWEPEWGIATSTAHRDRVSEFADPGTFVGWVMYFSRGRGTVPPLPGPVRLEPVEDKGTLIVLTPERFTAANPEHVALAEQVRELLEGAGLLHPLQPAR